MRQLGCVLTLTLTLAAPLGAASFEPAPCPFELPSGQVEGVSVECGYLVVPEDRAGGGGPLRLAVATFRNPNSTGAPDPVVYLAGGPGASALELVRYSFRPAYAPLFSTGRDVILFDQRGIGVSQPALDCPRETATTAEWLACAEGLRAAADLSDYHTAASAADVEDLRLALGYGPINLWGGSYGTRLALDVMRDHPEGLRSVVLDAVYPPDVDLLLDTPGNVDRAFGHLFASCAADAACDAAWPDLAGTLQAAVTRLDAAPATIRTRNPLTAEEIDLQLAGGDLVAVLFQFLYATPVLPELPRMIHDAAQARFDVIERYLGSFIAQADVTSRGMQFSVLCHDEVAFSSRAQHEAMLGAFPLLAPLFRQGALGTQAYDVCAGWGAGRAGDVENAPVTSGVPTLLLAGEFDPITPPAWAHHAAASLTSGRVVQLPAIGHGAGTETCGRDLLRAFIEDPAAPLDTTCVSTLRVRWSVPGVAATARVSGKELLGQLLRSGPPPLARPSLR